MDIDALRGVLQRHGASFVLEDFEAAEATGGHHEGFLDCVRFKLSRRTDLSDAARDEVFDCAHERGQFLTARLVSLNDVGEVRGKYSRRKVASRLKDKPAFPCY